MACRSLPRAQREFTACSESQSGFLPAKPRVVPTLQLRRLYLASSPNCCRFLPVVSADRIPLRSLTLFFARPLFQLRLSRQGAQPAPGADFTPGELIAQYSQHAPAAGVNMSDEGLPSSPDSVCNQVSRNGGN